MAAPDRRRTQRVSIPNEMLCYVCGEALETAPRCYVRQMVLVGKFGAATYFKCENAKDLPLGVHEKCIGALFAGEFAELKVREKQA